MFAHFAMREEERTLRVVDDMRRLLGRRARAGLLPRMPGPAPKRKPGEIGGGIFALLSWLRGPLEPRALGDLRGGHGNGARLS